jgi:CMP-N,N'-diacetyllegionaminic acid synthase
VGRQIVALIPARGGSQGVPRKNLVDVGGKSLLERAVNSAQSSQFVTEIFVSSDDDEILRVAESLGVRAVRRPNQLALDLTRATAVVDHLVKFLSEGSWTDEDVIVYLQPTSPFRKSHHVDGALEQMHIQESQGVVSVKVTHEHASKSLQISSDETLVPSLFYSDSSANRQELPTYYHPNGAIYAFTVGRYRAEGDFPTLGSAAFVMTQIDSLDIDSTEDLEIARALANYAGI